MFCFFLVWLVSFQRTVTFVRSYGIRKKFYKQLEEVLNWILIFSSNSGSYYFSSESDDSRLCLSFKKTAFSVIQMSITSNLKQSESLVYFIMTLNIEKKAIEARPVKSPRNNPAVTRRPMDVPWRSPKDPNVRDLQGTFRGLLGDQKNWLFNEKGVF